MARTIWPTALYMIEEPQIASCQIRGRDLSIDLFPWQRVVYRDVQLLYVCRET